LDFRDYRLIQNWVQERADGKAVWGNQNIEKRADFGYENEDIGNPRPS
jgi:hypothetical protein